MTDTEMVDCGCCGRTHENLGLDCRAFRTCPKCGDGYAAIPTATSDRFALHVEACTGEPSWNIVDEDEQEAAL